MVFESLFAHARDKPTDIAITDDRGVITWAQFAAAASGLSMYLGMQTDKPRVGLLLPTSAGFAVSFYATLLAGKTAVPLNFLLSEREIIHCIADSGVDTIITINLLALKFEKPLAAAGINTIDLTALPPPAPDAPVLANPKLPSVAADDLAVVMYTSGTAGLPKGVMLSYGNLQSDADSAIAHARLDRTHKFLGIIPLFHSTGMLATLLAPVRLGATIVYQARFNPTAAMTAIRDQQISIVAAVPSMYAAICRLKDAGPGDVKTLYAAISGGEPLPPAVFAAFKEKFGIPLYEGYGLTETIGPIAFNVPHAIEQGSVGRLMATAEAKFIGDNGKEVPPGEPGELWLRGPMIMKGYLNNPDATANALTPDGFFKTGDIGRFDASGYLHITGRKKDVIIVAGEKVTPREIEDAILKNPAVADVAVVGRKDPSRGEAVVAFVVVKEGETVTADSIRATCRQQGLTQWKLPKDVHVVADLPRSPTGKVLKRVLVEQLQAANPS